MSKLENFALYVLETLEQDRSWSSDTLDNIQAGAIDLNLARTADDGHFEVLGEGL